MCSTGTFVGPDFGGDWDGVLGCGWAERVREERGHVCGSKLGEAIGGCIMAASREERGASWEVRVSEVRCIGESS
jgi:hypothetical protein